MGERKSKFNLLSIIVLLIVAVILINILITPQKAGVTINFLNVGQGDAAIVTNSHNQSILIDGGPNSTLENQLVEVLPFYQRKITTIILSHPHADHLNGLIEVIKKYEVDNIYSTGVLHTTPEYIDFLTIIKEKNINFKTLKQGDRLIYEDDLEIKVLFPDENLAQKKIDNLNNSSLALRLTYGNIDTLFMGDLEEDGQKQLMNTYKEDFASEIVKVPHHGSKDSVNMDFITKVMPKVSIFSVGKDNKFNHPSQSALDAYKSTKIYRTDQDGTIKINISKESIVSIETD